MNYDDYATWLNDVISSLEKDIESLKADLGVFAFNYFKDDFSQEKISKFVTEYNNKKSAIEKCTEKLAIYKHCKDVYWEVSRTELMNAHRKVCGMELANDNK